MATRSKRAAKTGSPAAPASRKPAPRRVAAGDIGPLGSPAAIEAATVAEQVAGNWLKELFGLPADATFGFTTGCQMAHVTALAAARHAVLERAGWDVEADGLAGSPPITVVAGANRHVTLGRALRLLGIGQAQIADLVAYLGSL